MNIRISFVPFVIQFVSIAALFALPTLMTQLAWAQPVTCSDNTDCAPIEYCAKDLVEDQSYFDEWSQARYRKAAI